MSTPSTSGRHLVLLLLLLLLLLLMLLLLLLLPLLLPGHFGVVAVDLGTNDNYDEYHRRPPIHTTTTTATSIISEISIIP